MSGNHPQARPMSMMNRMEDSLHDPVQEVLQIAPAESNFLTLKADSASDTVWTFNLTTPSPSTLISQDMNIYWQATVTVPEGTNLPPMFAPVSNPLAKIAQSLRMTINGKTLTCEPYIIAKITEGMRKDDHQSQERSTDPCQPVRGACIGDIPVCGGPVVAGQPCRYPQKDYYFGGTTGNGMLNRPLPLGDVNCPRSMFNPTKYHTDNTRMPVKVSTVRTNQAQIATGKTTYTYEFLSPVPHDLFTDRENGALVNVNEIQLQIQFHTNLMGRLFAWRGDFTTNDLQGIVPIDSIACQITNTAMLYPLLLYRAVTSSNESSVPPQFTTMYNEYRIVREADSSVLDPDTKYLVQNNAAFTPPPGATVEDFKKLRIAMKPVRLSHIPPRIYIWATQNESSFNTPVQCATSYDAAAAAGGGLLNFAGAQNNAALPDFALVGGTGAAKYLWYYMSGVTPIPATRTFATLDDVVAYFSTLGVAALANLASPNAQTGAVNVAAPWTLLRAVPFVYDAKVGGSQGWGNEIPSLKISDVRITLNNKINLLMSPDEDSDRFYYRMCHKNGLCVNFEDFKRGGPIVIDVGEDLGARGLVTGASGLFDCQVFFSVQNFTRENAIVDVGSQRACNEVYSHHPYKALSGGIYSYVIYQYPVTLTLEPMQADISMGIPLDDVEAATRTVVPMAAVHQKHEIIGGGILAGFNKKISVRRAWQKGLRHAQAAHAKAGVALQKGQELHNKLQSVIGAGGNMYS